MKIVLLDSVVNDIEISSTARGLKKKHEVVHGTFVDKVPEFLNSQYVSASHLGERRPCKHVDKFLILCAQYENLQQCNGGKQISYNQCSTC